MPQPLPDTNRRVKEVIDRFADDGLRDEATMEEKKYWNALRGKLPECWDILQKLDSSVSDKRAAIKL